MGEAECTVSNSIPKNYWSSEGEEEPEENVQAEEVPTEEKKKKFRLHGKNFFLTFPMCQTTKEVALKRILEKFSESKALVCHEKHMSGDDHLHCLIQFEKKKDFRQNFCFDFIGGKHGKYEPCRDIKKAVEYITKKGDYISEGINVESILAKKSPKQETIARLLDKGIPLVEVREKEMGYYMMNKRKLQEFETECVLKKKKESREKWIEFTETELQGMNPSSWPIAEWLNKNMFKERPFKQEQLYIYGQKNLGKTTLVRWLENFACVYWMPTSEDFYDMYSEDFHDLIVLDEFRGEKRITELNQWLQGSEMNLRKKGSQSIKRKNLSMIILSNFSPEECYENMLKDESNRVKDKIDTFKCRLVIHEITERLNLF